MSRVDPGDGRALPTIGKEAEGKEQMPPLGPAPEGQVDLAAGSVRRQRLRTVVDSLSVTGGLIVLIVIFSFASPYFISTSNIYRIFQQVAVVAVLAVGQSFVIYTAGIDLSQAAIVGLGGVVGASIMVQSHDIAFGVLAALAVCALAGAVNGLLITRAKLVPFIATLAMLGICSGAALLYTGGQPVFNIPAAFNAFGSNGAYVFPFIVMVAAGIAIFFQFFSTATRSGRYVYAIGSNERAARIAGVRVNRTLVAVYALSGLLAGVAAMLNVAYVNTAQPTLDVNLELDAIAAVVIGGG
ncbi:MAG: ABC transporter permease, partial [Acidimicrobiales bacterium]